MFVYVHTSMWIMACLDCASTGHICIIKWSLVISLMGLRDVLAYDSISLDSIIQEVLFSPVFLK